MHGDIAHSDSLSHMYTVLLAGNFRWVKFSLKTYFRGLIFIVCPEHCLHACSSKLWVLGAFRDENNENKTQPKCPAMHTVYIANCNNDYQQSMQACTLDNSVVQASTLAQECYIGSQYNNYVCII